MSEDSGDDDLGIKPNSIIDSLKANYVVERMLGEGGFGAVYLVHLDTDKSKRFAIKVEKKLDTRKHSKLKMEIAILKMVANARKERSHFTQIVDKGKKSNFYFLVMQLVGKSLADLKLAQKDKVFSMGTGLGVGVQCLEAVEDLHNQGFIHRDLKPANYACGLDAQKHVIYILDFGIARKIFKRDDKDLKTPRAMVGFKGTVRFASLACHKGQDMSMKDDCESWFYLLLDLILREGLPWRRISDKNDVRDCKERCKDMNSPEHEKLYSNFPNCRKKLAEIMFYIGSLAYPHTPDYPFMYKLLKEAAENEGASIDDPYDWEQEEGKTKRQSGKARA